MALFCVYSENAAPKRATTETIVAAIRNSEGIAVVAADEMKATRSRSVVESRIRMIRSGTALFTISPIVWGLFFCLKEFLSRFLD